MVCVCVLGRRCHQLWWCWGPERSVLVGDRARTGLQAGLCMMWCCVRLRSTQQPTEASFGYAVAFVSCRSLDIVLPVSNVPCLLTSLWIIEKVHGPSASLFVNSEF
jgi:hypothetical protein